MVDVAVVFMVMAKKNRFNFFFNYDLKK